MFTWLQAWIRSKNITTHSVGAAIVAFVGAYDTVPAIPKYIATVFAGYPVVPTKIGELCMNIGAGIALWRNFAHSSSAAGKVAAAEAILASPNAPSPAAVAAASTAAPAPNLSSKIPG